jgi:hypothetical protein
MPYPLSASIHMRSIGVTRLIVKMLVRRMAPLSWVRLFGSASRFGRVRLLCRRLSTGSGPARRNILPAAYAPSPVLFATLRNGRRSRDQGSRQ